MVLERFRVLGRSSTESPSEEDVESGRGCVAPAIMVVVVVMVVERCF